MRLYVLLPLLLFFLPTVLMGLSFPVLQRAVHDDPATSGRKVGALQAANIAGCAAGSLLGPRVLEHLGTPGTLRLLLGLGIVFALVGPAAAYGRVLRRRRRSCSPCSPPLLPGPDRLWRRLHGVTASAPLVLLRARTPRASWRPHPGRRRLAAVGQRQGQQPGCRTGAATPCSAQCRRPVHPAPGRGRRRPRLGRHGVGRGVPRGDALGDGVRDLRPAAEDPVATGRGSWTPVEPVASSRTRAGACARSRTGGRRSRRRRRATTSSRRRHAGPRRRGAATCTRSSSSRRPRAA